MQELKELKEFPSYSIGKFGIHNPSNLGRNEI